MSQVICIKCGATGDSKCPSCRNVFMDNQMEAVLSWNIAAAVMEAKNGEKFFVLGYKVPKIDGIGIKTEADAEEYARERLQELIKDCVTQSGVEGVNNERYQMPTLSQLLCNHDMHYRPGGKCHYGCGYEEPLVDTSKLEPNG